MKKALPILVLCFIALITTSVVWGQEFKPNLTQGVMKYQALRDTEIDPNAALREQGMKDWKQKRDTILAKAKKLLDQKDYTGVNQLLFPYDYLEPDDATFYDYLGKSYYYAACSSLHWIVLNFLRTKEKQRALIFYWPLL